MEIPEYAIQELKKIVEQQDRIFAHTWGVLPPSIKRDEIMWHMITAKHKLNEFIKENDNYVKRNEPSL